jgi:hypothetical protein
MEKITSESTALSPESPLRNERVNNKIRIFAKIISLQVKAETKVALEVPEVEID